MPVSIAGMHRSGTSMVARLLNLCGLDLGPADQMLPPSADNPEGFWENAALMQLNESILQAVGATWYEPPAALDPDDPRLRVLLGDASAAVAGLCAREPWGWKDPRNSVTLPFWRELLPGLKVVICVRNPLEVAQSLRDRDGFAYAQTLGLWHDHYRRLLADAPAADRVVTHYDAYFADPAAELRRVLDALGMACDDETARAACAAVMPALRHTRLTPEELAAIEPPAAVLACYEALRREGGPVLAAARPPEEARPQDRYLGAVRYALELEAEADGFRSRVARHERQVHDLNAELARSAGRENELAARLAAAEQEAAALREQLTWRRYRFADRIAHLIAPVKRLLAGRPARQGGLPQSAPPCESSPLTCSPLSS